MTKHGLQPAPRVLVIIGSARGNSNTLQAVKNLCPYEQYELLDLRHCRIRNYEYDPSTNEDDDFKVIAAKLLDSDVIIFATPVYWYSMSGSMKVFFDRLTDLTGKYKSIGKALKHKRTYLIASGGSPTLPEGFEVPFRKTSEYFDMLFIEAFYQQGE